jgi:hypothetical protein
VALMALTGATLAAEPSGTQQAYIPFANHGGIRDWEADRDRGVWVQDIHRKWYYAKLMSPCIGLNFANTIAFDTRPQGRFDQFSSIYVPGGSRCAVQSFTVSGAPPGKKGKPDSISPPPAGDSPGGQS